ncbi:hypothetical protein VC83_06007 [Pseudogymnoascus destructans]|uniref:FAD-binding PCMH-type domain-containing protein n=2 Tax=Pseudogymnoascus destructans TaxID=655981 RepID=L8FX57_PSED2|nr:uncharacterized protein VC83_06007 [Pseudogymnoascus destructans]ELR04311.1 hypothetical protein GMDG_06700 [Pseudogymnoascus destructans 20631-21]OAF57051.1 hypothetical protein VC83_06007 [Pseudogymnoascus destructans]
MPSNKLKAVGRMGASQSALEKSIKAALGGDDSLYAFPEKSFYQNSDVKPYNLSIPITPAAITYPKTTAQVAAIIKCAVETNLKVQARSGGHSYGNYSLGGVSGAVVIDLRNFQQFSMDRTTWQATVGAGTLLGDLTKRMHEAGNRAMAHGICPQVGIGGHATIGGLGPSSRLWGSALDHIEEVEIVLADSTIRRCSATQNPDIFWAVKGAGASFGVVTEFKLRTEPEPGEVVEFEYSFTVGSYASKAAVFKRWQSLIADPGLTRKFATKVAITGIGMIISGTYFGSKAEYDAFDMKSKLGGDSVAKTIVFQDWLGLLGHWAEDAALLFAGGLPSHFYNKTLTFNGATLISDEVIDNLFAYLDEVAKGTLLWFLVFSLTGGAVNDIAQDATSYAHRDALFYFESYGISLVKVSKTTKDFIAGINTTIKNGVPGVEDLGSYAGYVDPELPNGPQQYWRTNLPKLEQIKAVVDPGDVFHNPQSVRPAGSTGRPSKLVVGKRAKWRSFFRHRKGPN